MFARTKRLTLRPAWPEDAAALAQAIGHDAVIRMLLRVPHPYRLADAEAFAAVELPRHSHAGADMAASSLVSLERAVALAAPAGPTTSAGVRA